LLRTSIGRREVLVGAGALVTGAATGCGGCGERQQRPASSSASPVHAASAAAGPAPTGGWTELAWSEAEVPPEGQAALVWRGADDAEAPLVIALHGRGEAGRGLSAGARGWRDDYAVERVDERLRAGELAATDLGGFATEQRIADLRASIAGRPYRGVILMTPYTPVVPDRSAAGARGFARFLEEKAIPRAAAIAGREVGQLRVGIDGVSMGGRLALWAAVATPARYASVGALQPAISVGEADDVAARLVDAHARSAFSLRLVSSEEDPFLEAVRALASKLDRRGLAHRLVVTPGPHDYAWNRGPGGAELLLHHERVLRGLPPP
jgi:hypothetical protein